ncbi:MAG: hypothetical protein P8105_09935 [Dehalococcoidia bacterium]
MTIIINTTGFLAFLLHKTLYCAISGDALRFNNGLVVMAEKVPERLRTMF